MSHSPSEKPPRRGILVILRKYLRDNLLAGILVVTPMVATIFFMRFLLNWVDKVLVLLPEQYRPEHYLPFPIPGLGLLLLFGVLLLIGFLVRNYLGRELVALGDKIVSYIPFVNHFYHAVKQLLVTIFSATSKDFKRVVLIEYPRRGLYALAFVTGVAAGEVQEKTRHRVVNVFLPTTPNPTSGFYLMVPEEDVVPLDMTVEAAFKIIISGGFLNSEESMSKNKPKQLGADHPKEENL